MRKLLATISVLSVISLTACGGGAASSGVSGGAAKPTPSAEIDAARAEAEAQEKKLSELRQEKAELEAQLEGKSAPAASTAPAATPAPTAAPAGDAKAAPAAPAAKPAKGKGK